MNSELEENNTIKKLLKQVYFTDLTLQSFDFGLRMIHKDRILLKWLNFPKNYYRIYFLVLDVNNKTLKRKVPHPEKDGVKYLLKLLNNADATT